MSTVCKKIREISPTAVEIKHFNHLNFITSVFGKLIFDSWGHKWALIFVFMCYSWSGIRNKAFDISQGVFSLLFWKIEFFKTPFCTIASFYKIIRRSKTSGHSKKPMWFSALESKIAYAQLFFSSFWRQKSILRWK